MEWRGERRSPVFTFTSASISFPLPLFYRGTPVSCWSFMLCCWLLVLFFSKRIKQTELVESGTWWRFASMCPLFSERRWADTHLCWHTNTYWDSPPRLINTKVVRGISFSEETFIVHRNRHPHPHYSHIYIHIKSLTWIPFGKLSVLLSRRASWNFARASRSFAISHL